MRTLFKNIKGLVQIRQLGVHKVDGKAMDDLPQIENAFLLVEDGLIRSYGEMKECPSGDSEEIVDASGRFVLPAWCDSHTHLVFAGDRESEFVDRIKGLTYQEIAEKGGGILNSAKKLQALSEEQLYAASKHRLEKVMALGTGAIEIKSGYGLTVEAETKMLRVVKRLKEDFPLEVKATFLAAHALPLEYKEDKSGFIDLMLHQTLAQVAQEKLADYIDVFCEKGYFDLEDTERIIKAAAKFGLAPKLHVNQFNAFGGVALGVKYGALSLDHLEELTVQDIEALKGSTTMPVALPGCSFFLGIPYTPARQLIDAGLPLALATDYNPGSAPSGNMNLVLSLACIKMKMTPNEAINAMTLNGAYAMGVSDTVGSITVGKKANLILTQPINSLASLPYSFGKVQFEKVYIAGKLISP